MHNSTDTELVFRLFRGTGPTYDYIVNLCTLGFDTWWKKVIMKHVPPTPVRILDQACGTGILTFKIAQKYPGCQVIGVDVQEEYLSIAQKKKQASFVNNIDFVLGRAEDVYLKQTFDCITSSYLAKYADLPILIRNVKAMLRDRGVLIMHDFTYPSVPCVASVLELYFKAIRSMGNRRYPQWKIIFAELPELLRATHWVQELLTALRSNGFQDIALTRLMLGISTIVTARNLTSP